MAKMPRNFLTLLLLLLVGSVFGSIIGQVLEPYVSFLNYGQTLGLQPATLNLYSLSLTFGFILKLNVAGIIGFLLALIVYSRT